MEKRRWSATPRKLTPSRFARWCYTCLRSGLQSPICRNKRFHHETPLWNTLRPGRASCTGRAESSRSCRVRQREETESAVQLPRLHPILGPRVALVLAHARRPVGVLLAAAPVDLSDALPPRLRSPRSEREPVWPGAVMLSSGRKRLSEESDFIADPGNGAGCLEALLPDPAEVDDEHR